MKRVSPERYAHFLFGFSYYGVLKIRFVPSRILQMFCISFHTTRINPVPTNVDITRRYSILSPVECDGEVGGESGTIVRLPTGGLL